MARYVVTLRDNGADVVTGVRTNLTLTYEHVTNVQVMPGPVLALMNHANNVIAVIPVDQVQSCVCAEADTAAPAVSPIIKPTLAFDSSKIREAR